jgi:glycosyltransferase involved in cell wall biosynthesis
MPFPSMPVGFWNDPDGRKYHAAYFDRYPGVWRHGDGVELTPHGGIVIYGRSDATLNPGGVRIGTAEIYRQVEQLDDVLESVARLRERGIDAVLLLVGDGPDRDHVEQRASELGIIRHCFFLGYQEDVSGWYQAFDTLILPSANEGTPVVVIEALASGCPVVATSVGGVPDVVREGVDGFLVRAGDVDALAERLAQLAADPELRFQMGEAGRESVPERYAVERLVGDIDELYRSLL